MITKFDSTQEDLCFPHILFKTCGWIYFLSTYCVSSSNLVTKDEAVKKKIDKFLSSFIELVV